MTGAPVTVMETPRRVCYGHSTRVAILLQTTNRKMPLHTNNKIFNEITNELVSIGEYEYIFIN